MMFSTGNILFVLVLLNLKILVLNSFKSENSCLEFLVRMKLIGC